MSSSKPCWELRSSELAGHDLDLLAAEQGPVFGLDRELRLALTTGGWDAFALANQGARTLTDYPIGRSFLDAVPDALTEFYEQSLRQALASGEVWRHTYMCSSPDDFREFEMTVYPLAAGAGLLVVNSLSIESPHPTTGPVPVLRGDVMGQCCHCRRFRTHPGAEGLGNWTFVGAWLNAPPAPISHGICGPCAEHYYPG